MAQLFSRGANTFSRLSIIGVLLLIVAIAWVGTAIDRSHYMTGVGIPREQPVQFSHEHHVKGLGIQCLYCHSSVEVSSFAGLPPTETCMTCHSQIWADSPYLEPVRASLRDNTPLVWTRVTDLPGFVYFNHNIHVTKGIGCETCHGRVDNMPLMWKAHSMTMAWCLNCHRHPALYVRPREEVYTMGYRPAEDQSELGGRLVREYRIRSLLDCYTCHR